MCCSFYMFPPGDASGSKVIEDWICPVNRSSPSSTSPFASTKGRFSVVSQANRKSQSSAKDANSAARKILSSVAHDKTADSGSLSHPEIPGHILLSTVGCLSLLLILIGAASYCRAARN